MVAYNLSTIMKPLITLSGGSPSLSVSSSDRLPYSIRVLLESAVRNCDEFLVKSSDVESILNWKETQTQTVEVPFRPARVILQDFTYVWTIFFNHQVKDLACLLFSGLNSLTFIQTLSHNETFQP